MVYYARKEEPRSLLTFYGSQWSLESVKQNLHDLCALKEKVRSANAAQIASRPANTQPGRGLGYPFPPGKY